MTKNETVVKAVKDLKDKNPFGLTGIKVELEAKLNRNQASCVYCHGDSEVQCENCVGEVNIYCEECNEDGLVNCEVCSQDGDIECEDCHGAGIRESNSRAIPEIECSECEGRGYIPCLEDDCEEGLVPCHIIDCNEGIITCEQCDEGMVNCLECPETNFENEDMCGQFLLEKMSEHGLAERINGEYEPVYPLVYSEFYDDPSVDSEWTFTIAVDDPETVLKLPKFVEAFNALAEEIGNGINAENAGMHMALLNAPGAEYPGGNIDEQRFETFKKSLTQLLPALYFLGSSNEKCRSMRFRAPSISAAKRNAVCYGNGALEFRIFDTCYETPETILDNVVVMRNAMKYWRRKYKSPGLHKITDKIKFGHDNSNKLDRLYMTMTHIDLLNRGLERLKPNYYTIREIKQQRKFTIDKRHIKKKEKAIREKAKAEYKEYEQRFGWKIMALRHDLLNTRYRNEEESGKKLHHNTIKKHEREVEKFIKKEKTNKIPPDKYIQEKIHDKCGDYELELEAE